MINGLPTIPISGRAASAIPSAADRSRHAPLLVEFVAGTENSLAAAALKPLLESSQAVEVVNPLVLYGPHGCGKSHLAQGLAESWAQRNPQAVVVVLSGAEFVRQYLAAHTQDQLDVWRASVREADLFLLDDLGELVGKTSAQQELLHTLDALADRQAQVIVTARSLPSQWRTLTPALRSRFSAALAVSLALPSRETRRAILEHVARSRNLPLARRVLDGLAEGLSGSVPALVSAMGELELAARVQGEQTGGEQMSELITRRKRQNSPTLRDIVRTVAKHFGLKVSELKSPERRRSLVAARCVAMYLARQLTDCSLGQIGEFLGGRDHTTVLHGCRKTEKLLRHDAALRQAIAEVKRLLVTA